MQMSLQRRYRSTEPIGGMETSLRSPARTTSPDYAALRALSSGGRPEFGFEAERVAEREGFEPSVRFPVHTLSKRAP